MGWTRFGEIEPGGAVSAQDRPELPSIQRCEDLLRDLLPRVEKFPKGYKFTLGDRIVAAALDVFELLVRAVTAADLFGGARSLVPGGRDWALQGHAGSVSVKVKD